MCDLRRSGVRTRLTWLGDIRGVRTLGAPPAMRIRQSRAGQRAWWLEASELRPAFPCSSCASAILTTIHCSYFYRNLFIRLFIRVPLGSGRRRRACSVPYLRFSTVELVCMDSTFAYSHVRRPPHVQPFSRQRKLMMAFAQPRVLNGKRLCPRALCRQTEAPFCWRTMVGLRLTTDASASSSSLFCPSRAKPGF